MRQNGDMHARQRLKLDCSLQIEFPACFDNQIYVA